MDLLSQDVRAVIEQQGGSASERLSDPNFTDSRTGRHMGRDELFAVAYLRSIDVNPCEDDGHQPAAYLERILAAVRLAKIRFASQEQDPEGFGLGTFGEIEAWLEKKQAQFASAKPHPFRDRWRT